MSLPSIDSSAFRHHVDRHLEPLRADLSSKRRAAWKQLVLRTITSIVLLGSVAASGWWTYRAEDDFYWWMLAFAVFAFGVALFVWCAMPWFKHRDRIKHDVLTRLVPFFGDFSYRPEGTMSPSDVEDTGLLPRYNDHFVEDEVTGSYRGVALRAVDVRLRYEYETRSSGGSGHRKEVEKVFDGVLMTLELPTPAACEVLLGTPDCFKGRFAVNEDVWQRFDLPRENLEAWTRDPKACAGMLDTNLIDRVVALMSVCGVRRLRMAWHGTRLALLLDFGEDFFELPFRGEIDFRRFGEIVERQLTCLTGVINLLDVPATVEFTESSSRSLEQRMGLDTRLERDFETQDRGCLPMVMFTSLGFCAYLWLLVDVVRPLGALGLAFVFGTVAGFGLASVLFGERNRRSALVLLLIGLLGLAPALPAEWLQGLPLGEWVQSLKLDGARR
jgi:hypothetical protein